MAKYYCNGCVLPSVFDLQSQNQGNFWYVVGDGEDRAGAYFAYSSNTPWYVIDTDNGAVLYADSDASSTYYMAIVGSTEEGADTWIGSEATGSLSWKAGDTIPLEGSPRLIWSNSVIPYGSADSTEIYKEVDFPIPYDNVPIAAYYYGDYLLPAIPSDLLETYPYAMILKLIDDEGEVCGVLLSTKPLYIAEIEDGEGALGLFGEECVLEYNVVGVTPSKKASSISWVETGGEHNVNGMAVEYPEDVMTILWSNYDVVFGSADSTEIFFSVSEKPVPYGLTYYAVPRNKLVALAEYTRKLNSSTDTMTLDEILNVLEGAE